MKLLKKIFKEIYYDFIINKAIKKKQNTKKLTLDEISKYWKDPVNSDAHNNPTNYVSTVAGSKRSENLVSIIKNYCNNEGSVIELGCNAGRNLNYLFNAGYNNLSAIEISKIALNQFKTSFPKCFNKTSVIHGSIEDKIKKIDSNKYNIVFTMAVLQHIPYENDYIFDEMVRISAGYLIIWEVEDFSSPRHFPRNYRKVFEKRNMRQIEHTKRFRVFKHSDNNFNNSK